MQFLAVEVCLEEGKTVFGLRCAEECTLYTVHCTLYTVRCTLYTVHCTLYTVQRIAYSVKRTAYRADCSAVTRERVRGAGRRSSLVSRALAASVLNPPLLLPAPLRNQPQFLAI
eukprot:1550603-Rhodomonas_salina.2